jgi:diguanylate cyclase (GGDEF)-like protein
MTLRNKFLLGFFFILLLFSFLIFLSIIIISQNIINNYFIIKSEEYKNNFLKILQNQKLEFINHIKDYAYWNDMGEKGVLEKDKDWLKDNLEPWVRKTFGYDIVALFHENGNIIIKSPFNEISYKDLIPENLKIESDFYVTKNNIILYTISPVFDSSGKKFFHAFIVFGKVIDEKILEKWKSMLSCEIAIKTNNFVFYTNPAILSLYSSKYYYNNYIHASLILKAKNEEFIVYIFKYEDLPKKIFSNLYIIFGISLFLILILSILLTNFMVLRIFKPLNNFQKIAEEISLGRYDINLNMERNDEIGKLTESFKRMLENISEREKALIYAKKIAEEASLIDELTGVPNRRFLYQYVENLINMNKKFAIVFLDLDKFKNINDFLGHTVGDKILIEVANWFKENLRGEDKIIRYGGDEFCLILNENDRDKIEKIMRRLYLRFLEKEFLKGIALGFSYGIAIFPDDGNNLDMLLSKADQEMYKMKENGEKN